MTSYFIRIHFRLVGSHVYSGPCSLLSPKQNQALGSVSQLVLRALPQVLSELTASGFAGSGRATHLLLGSIISQIKLVSQQP